MKSHNLSRYDQITVDPSRGGYSDIRLWPCYMVFSSLILSLAPKIGMLPSIILVGVSSFLIAKKVADMTISNKPLVRYDIEKWVDDMRAAEDKGLTLPTIEAYAYIEPVTEKQKVAKQPKPTSSRPAFKQISIEPRIRTKKPTLQSV